MNFLVPRGDVVAETAEDVQRLARGLPFTTRLARRLRSRGAAAGLVAAVAVAAAADGGFVVAAAGPSEVVRFSPDGARAGQAVGLTGEPAGVARVLRPRSW